MTDFSRDPVYNAIQEGIKEDIRVTFEQKRFRAATILIYAGMNAMAVLSMPASQQDVKPADFIAWADRYIRFDGSTQVPGNDLYGARCEMLHSYGSKSTMSRNGHCRMIGYYIEDTYIDRGAFAVCDSHVVAHGAHVSFSGRRQKLRKT